MVLGTANDLNGIGRDSPIINLAERALDISLRTGDTVHYTEAWKTSTMDYFLSKRNNPWDRTLDGVTGDGAIDKWMRVGEESQAIEYSPRQPLAGYIEARNETKMELGGGSWSGLKHEEDYEGPINGIGKAISATENARQMAVNFENSSVYNAFIRFANKNDLEFVGNNPTSFSYGFIPDDAIAAVPKNPEEGISFYLGLRYRQLLAREVESLGVRASDDRLHTMIHEYTHLLRETGTGRALSEKEVEEFLTGLFLSLRDKQYKGHSSAVSGSEDSGTLRSERQQYHNAAFISAVRAAGAEEGLLEKLVGVFGKRGLEHKIAELEKEAEEQGLEGKGAKEYVTKKIEEYAKDSEKEYKNGKEGTSERTDEKTEKTGSKETEAQDSGESK